jgi:hypothetical protein
VGKTISDQTAGQLVPRFAFSPADIDDPGSLLTDFLEAESRLSEIVRNMITPPCSLFAIECKEYDDFTSSRLNAKSRSVIWKED